MNKADLVESVELEHEWTCTKNDSSILLWFKLNIKLSRSIEASILTTEADYVSMGILQM